MRALTLYPHWAHAVLYHGKRVENRSRPIPKALVGKRVVLHAGVCPRVGWWEEVVSAAGGAVSMADRPHEVARRDVCGIDGPWGQWGGLLQCRALVGTAVLVPMAAPREGVAWGDPSARFWWGLCDVQALPNAVYRRRGQLGLWTVPSHQVAAVEAQLRGP